MPLAATTNRARTVRGTGLPIAVITTGGNNYQERTERRIPVFLASRRE